MYLNSLKKLNKPIMKRLKILAAPPAITFSDSVSSTAQMSYKLITLLNKYGIEYHAIFNNINLQKKVSEDIILYKINSKNSFLDPFRMEFAYKSSRLARKILSKENIALIHHIGPFAYNVGFNFLPAFHNNKKLKIIIGPVEPPHFVLKDDFEHVYGMKRFLSVVYPLAILGRKLIQPLLWHLFNKTINKCEILVAVNEETKKLFSRIMDESKIRVIPLGVNISEFEFSMPPDNHLILAAGIHIKRKGIDYLIQAMPRIMKEFPDTKLHILGNGPRRSILENLAKKVGAEENVIFHGRVPREKVIEMFKNCRVFCHPTLSDAFTPIRLEAMASGRPIVATTAASGHADLELRQEKKQSRNMTGT